MMTARRIRWIVRSTALYVVAASSSGVASAQDAREAEGAGVRAPDGCDSAPSSTWTLFIGGGAVAGAGVGALVGAESVRWEVAFPRG